MCHSKTIELIKSKQVVSPDRMSIYWELVRIIRQLDLLYNAIIQAKICLCRACKKLKRREATQESAARFYRYMELNYQRLARPYLRRIILSLAVQFRLNLGQQNSLE